MRAGIALSLVCCANLMVLTTVHAQAKATLINGTLYRMHAGILEVQIGGKNILLVKTDAATIYWNGRTDKKAAAKELRPADQVIIEAVEKGGFPVAQKIRFAHAGNL